MNVKKLRENAEGGTGFKPFPPSRIYCLLRYGVKS
jgi:hypothetical protein